MLVIFDTIREVLTCLLSPFVEPIDNIMTNFMDFLLGR
jgi:hypothetical protein